MISKYLSFDSDLTSVTLAAIASSLRANPRCRSDLKQYLYNSGALERLLLLLRRSNAQYGLGSGPEAAQQKPGQ